MDEDEQCVDDGLWNPNPSQWATAQVEMVASRHSMVKRVSANNFSSSAGNQDARGNVTFCDGHGEMIGRKDALRRSHTGAPIAIPDDSWN